MTDPFVRDQPADPPDNYVEGIFEPPDWDDIVCEAIDRAMNEEEY